MFYRRLGDDKVIASATRKPLRVHNFPPTDSAIQRYTILKTPLPREVNKIKELADNLYDRMVAREDEAIQKLRQVLSLATADDCKRRSLRGHALA